LVLQNRPLVPCDPALIAKDLPELILIPQDLLLVRDDYVGACDQPLLVLECGLCHCLFLFSVARPGTARTAESPENARITRICSLRGKGRLSPTTKTLLYRLREASQLRWEQIQVIRAFFRVIRQCRQLRLVRMELRVAA
jgi:hypothetical protein